MAGVKIAAAANGGSAEIAGPPDSSANTVLKLPADTGSAGQVLAVASANHSGTNAELEWVDKDAASTGRKILEEVGSPCDGSVIASANGNITFPNVTASQTNGASYVEVTGSSISYNPPTGATQVHYRFSYYQADVDDPQLAHWRLYLDSDEVTKARNTTRVGYYAGMNHFEWIFNIGGNADTTVGRVASWSSAKTMKLEWREYSNAYNYKIHETVNWDGGDSAELCLPILRVKAIG